MSSAGEYLKLNTAELIARIAAKQLVYKGIAIGGVMVLRAIYPQALEWFKKHAGMRPLLLYLKPSQVVMEFVNMASRLYPCVSPAT